MLALNNVSKRFANLTAVDNLSFSLAAGTVLGLVGQNGAGKSTTFKMILNFLTPDSGRITLNGAAITADDLDQIGYLPEERGLYLDMIIEQQVLYFAQLHDYNPKQARRDLTSWLTTLEVKGNRRTQIKKLSKGNQQKVQLITALIHHPKLVILDEPFSGLDPVNTALLIDVVKKLRATGAAIIFSSHDMRNVTEVSDQVLMLANGQRKLYGPTDDIRNQFGKNKLYLEGIFDDLDVQTLPGLVTVTNDFPGKTLTFDNEAHAQAALQQAQHYPHLSGYRLLVPTLDDIFRKVVAKGAGQHA